MNREAIKVGFVAWVVVGTALSIYSYAWTGTMAAFGVLGFSSAAILLIYFGVRIARTNREDDIGGRRTSNGEKVMQIEPVLTKEFYHDGRGPCLQRVVWGCKGLNLLGFEYYNPDDVYDAEHLKHILLEGVQACSQSGEELRGNILWNRETNAAIVKIVESRWKASFDQTHLSNHEHFQIMFYDEIYDVICRSISAGKGRIPDQTEHQ